jgi:tetratricopeptide (TPR) repeat protein
MSVQTPPGPFAIGPAMNEALALHRQGRLRDAEKIYARVLKAAPDYFDALNLLGTVKAQLGRLGEAQRLLIAAVKIMPHSPQALANLGQVLLALKRPQEALDCLARARALSPDDIGILNNHANALLSLDRPQDALDEFREVLARVPQHPEARLNSGIAHAALGAPDEAVAQFEQALSIAPGHPAAHYNRGLALYALERYADAIGAHDAVLAVAPQHAGAWLNRGRALAALNRLDDALASYRKATAINKDDPDPHFMEGLALLARGDYRRGFEKYEWRWRRTGMPPQRSRGRPLWLGDYPLARKTVIVHAEQGFGDTIQFARYVPLLAAAGATVVLEVQRELTALMGRLAGGAAVIARGDAPPPFDVHCPLGSLPLALRTEPGTVPADVPYLTADDGRLAKWSARIGALPRPRIALAWSGNPDHMNDRSRSLAFAHLQPLLQALAPPLAGEVPVGARFISIQHDVRSEDAALLAGDSRITPIGGELEDFADTAAVIALCDVVIAADTAVAHLAGAMGRPVWVLLPFAPDWRWMLEGETTPWYPTARLFRQSAPGDWAGVIARVGAELSRFIAPAS